MTELLHAVVNGLNIAGEAHWQFAAAMFFQVCILATILLVLDVLLFRKTRAAIRYGIWSLVLVKLMLPVSLSSPIGLAQWLPEIPPGDRVTARITETSTSPHADAGSVAIPVPSPASHGPVDRIPVSLPPAAEPKLSQMAGSTHASVERHTAESTRTAIQTAITEPLPSLQWQAWVLLAWFTVVLTLGLYVLRRARQVFRLVSEASEAPVEMQTLLEECLERAEMAGRRMKLRVVDELGSPAICGFWRPTILLPRNLVGKLANEQLQFIFMHEICHWRRFDMHVNCLQTLLQVVYFYHPVVWMANAILRRTREQAVDEAVLVLLKSPRADYGETLLNVASIQRTAPTFSLRLVGVVESRKALAGRVRRILTRPLPKTARLGAAGLGAMVLSGAFLLPMAGHDEPSALAEGPPEAATEPNAPVAASDQPTPDAEVAVEPAVLYGRITDDTGAPVSEARVVINCQERGECQAANTDENGAYRIGSISQTGDYEIKIQSNRWIGITRRQDRPRIRLTPDSSVKRDFQLRRACRLHVRVVNEEGTPVERVQMLASPMADEFWRPEPRTATNAQGEATIGGLIPGTEYAVAPMHDDYGYCMLTVKLTDPEVVAEREIVIQKGKTITGKAVCSDGKPPVGWSIGAMPSWWRFGVSQGGSVVAEDGSFSLPHIVPGPYNVEMSIPLGNGFSTSRGALSNAELTEMPQPLVVKLNYPSAASLVHIEGRVEHSGGSEKHGFWLEANDIEHRQHASFYVREGESEFKIGPIPKGMYRLRISDADVEMEETRITAPATDVVLKVNAKIRPKLSGIVVDDSGKPIVKFRVRAIKLRTLKGPNFVEDANWREFKNENGQFETAVTGPGIYQLLAAAEGYAWSRCEPINTEEDSGKPVTLTLSKGTSLIGVVVNEQGQPVDGAQVIPLSKASGTMPQVVERFTTTDGATLTEDGRFELKNLPGKTETLKVTHPDYCFTILNDVNVAATLDEPARITLTRGGTVRGHVYDADGRPEPNVTLYFQDDTGYGGDTDELAGRFATAVTDANGAYEVKHLPEQLCHIHRAEEWNSFGVVRHCALPTNGQVSKVDFGGKTKLTGRLLVDGQPLGNTRVQLSSAKPSFGIYRAYAMTDDNGVFSFHGIASGIRPLYYQLPDQRVNWGRVRLIRVTSGDVDLGDINHITGRLTVNVAAADIAETPDLRVYLFKHNPVWNSGYPSGTLVHRQSDNEPFVFEQIPLGKHELICSRTGQFQTRQTVEVTAENRVQQRSLELPTGSASLRGKIDPSICGPGAAQSLNMWSRDRQRRRAIIPDDEGAYEVNHIPAGDYVICTMGIHEAPVLMEISLGEGEERTIDFTPDTISLAPTRVGLIQVQSYTADGIPLPCDLTLSGSAGPLTPSRPNSGRVTFVGAPGTYSLVASYPGFQEVQRQVELKPVGVEQRTTDDRQVLVRLNPDLP